MTLLFGFLSGPLKDVADAVSDSLGIIFQVHDSLWRGGEYYLYEAGSDRIVLQPNNDDWPPDEPAEQEFSEYPVLLYVETKRKEAVLTQMSNCRCPPDLLRSEEDLLPPRSKHDTPLMS